jgi:hypothetical protein
LALSRDAEPVENAVADSRKTCFIVVTVQDGRQTDRTVQFHISESRICQAFAGINSTAWPL